MNGLAGAAERRILEIVGSRVRAGRASITLPDGTHRAFEGRHAGPAAHVTLHRWRPLRLVTTTGAIGLADAYVRGDYDVDDLEAFLELCALHLEPAFHEQVPEWLHRLGRIAWRVLGNPSRPRGPLTDIVQHYDLGNEFYAEWLDETKSVLHELAAHHDLSWREDDGFGVSYARTLTCWLEAFDGAWPRIREMGFDDRFRRMWRYYLAYCGAGFASGRTDVRQIVLDRA